MLWSYKLNEYYFLGLKDLSGFIRTCFLTNQNIQSSPEPCVQWPAVDTSDKFVPDFLGFLEPSRRSRASSRTCTRESQPSQNKSNHNFKNIHFFTSLVIRHKTGYIEHVKLKLISALAYLLFFALE